VKQSGPQLTIARKSGMAALAKRFAGISRLGVYVGIPAASATDRSAILREMAAKTTNKKKRAKLTKAAAVSDVNNAELLFIHTNGSPINNIPKRPVLEPAVQADGNREAIASELAQATKAELDGDHPKAQQRIKRAGVAGQNAARGWFTDSRNGWEPNKPATVKRKGSARPLIDTGALRAAITYVVKEE
jgi:hypothetical protein